MFRRHRYLPPISPRPRPGSSAPPAQPIRGWARLLRASVTLIVALDQRQALRIGARCATTGVTDVIDISVALCARDRGHAVVTSDPGDIRAADPSLTVLSPA